MVIQHRDVTISQCAEKSMKVDDFHELKKAVQNGDAMSQQILTR